MTKHYLFLVLEETFGSSYTYVVYPESGKFLADGNHFGCVIQHGYVDTEEEAVALVLEHARTSLKDEIESLTGRLTRLKETEQRLKAFGLKVFEVDPFHEEDDE